MSRGPWPARLAWALGAVAVVVAALGAWLGWLTRATELPPDMDAGPSTAFFVGMLAFAVAGTLVAAHRPANPVGWALLFTGVAWEVFGLVGTYRVYALVEHPDLVGGGWAAWAWDVLWIPGLASIAVLFLIFPDGRLPSPRWRPVGVVIAGSTALLLAGIGLRPGTLSSTPTQLNPAGVGGAESFTSVVESIGNVGLGLGMIAAVAAPLVRYRRADAVQRYQLKWFAYAAMLVAAASITASVADAAGVTAVDLGDLRLVPLVLLPAAIALAILQYRLYDIDVVINKTILYATLVAFIGVVYVALVVGVGTLVGADDRANVPLTVAATALAAVTFQPARERLQRFANRLVYGQRANPYDVLASFTAHMTGTHPSGDVPAEMARAIGQGIGAASSEVWLRLGSQLRLAARWPDSGAGLTVPVPDGDTPLELPGADRTYPVRRDGRLLGALAVTKPPGERISSTEGRLLADLAAAAWLVLENVALIGELRASRQRLVTAQDTERRRVERNLHDGAQQRLLELALTLRMAHDQALRLDTDHTATTIEAAETQLRTALSELRELARGVHPAILTQRGLGPALESLAQRTSIPVTIDSHGEQRLPAAVEATAYFVVAEALTNVIKHAQAASAAISASTDDGHLRVVITDDGIGGADLASPGLGGLGGLADRVTALGGRLGVTSPDGGGTHVAMELPCE